ncbi:MAG: transposase [Flexibacter sp. CG_4_10_14_3_um_filter_32_15]|nr:MAG: transposase [Flexibacter sp. CG_4_10_14_3_um_filter_32_15]
MYLQAEQFYHVYNIGNNKHQLFFNRANYIYFLEFVRKHVSPCCEIINYCLMPNHFHFLISTTEYSAEPMRLGSLTTNRLSNAFRIVLSSYAKGVNVQQKRKNVLFKPKTIAKSLEESGANYAETCFHYIHQNPLKAGLVKKLEDWEFCSFRDYAKLRNGTLCNQELANQFIDFDKDNFLKESYQMIPDEKLKYIF